ncbi:unnamed protein product [Paramecium sonneborni]|uniref:Uncharacterized protein n=1 Tax=Paramecium sonneborni TaxID=65129 RepID=A0A8S1NQP5_9CILI|nr:unnamed protein product [Paramecium sonneborni]
MNAMKKMSESRHFSSQQQESSPLMNQSTNQSTKKRNKNKENINLFNEVNSLLQYYQNSNILKKKTSLPTSMVSPKKMMDDIFIKQVLQTRKTNSRNKVSVSQNVGQKVLSLSPIEQKQKSFTKGNQFRCAYHANKKAKFFEYNRNIGAIFYCSECSVGKLIKGNILFPVENYQVKQVSNKKRENQSVSRANFWSVDENSLLSNSPFLLESTDTFTSITDDTEDKAKELKDFQKSLSSLQQECQSIIENAKGNTYQTQFNTLNTELQQLLYMINIQSMKLLQQLQSQNHLQQVYEVQNELNSILSDIQSNESNILNNMSIKPFKQIMNKYKEKLKGHTQTINNCSSSQQIFELDDRLQKLNKVKKLLKTNFKMETDEQELLSTKRKLSSNVYISFENKEMFLAAAAANKANSIHAKDEPDLVQIDDKCHLLESPNFIQN